MRKVYVEVLKYVMEEVLYWDVKIFMKEFLKCWIFYGGSFILKCFDIYEKVLYWDVKYFMEALKYFMGAFYIEVLKYFMREILHWSV